MPIDQVAADLAGRDHGIGRLGQSHEVCSSHCSAYVHVILFFLAEATVGVDLEVSSTLHWQVREVQGMLLCPTHNSIEASDFSDCRRLCAPLQCNHVYAQVHPGHQGVCQGHQ